MYLHYISKTKLLNCNFRLKEEWANPEPASSISKSKRRKKIEPIRDYEEFVAKSKSTRKAIPGIPLEGEKNWVIGKFGRPLPIVQLSKAQSGGRRPIKHDPSKHCHCLRRIGDTDQEERVGNLTWQLDEQPHLQDNLLERLQQQRENNKKNKVKSNESASDDGKRKKRKTTEPAEDEETDKSKKDDTTKKQKKEAKADKDKKKSRGIDGEIENITNGHVSDKIEEGDNKSQINTTSEEQKVIDFNSSSDGEVEQYQSNISINMVNNARKIVTSPPLVSSTPFVQAPSSHSVSSKSAVISNRRQKPNATPASAGNLSQSIVEQLLSRQSALKTGERSGTLSHLGAQKNDDLSRFNSSSEEEEEDEEVKVETQKDNVREGKLFDFTLDDLRAAKVGTTKQQSSTNTAEISDIQLDSESNSDQEVNDNDDNKHVVVAKEEKEDGDGSLNLFDFTFDSLKAGATTAVANGSIQEMMGSMQMRWQNEDESSDTDGDGASSSEADEEEENSDLSVDSNDDSSNDKNENKVEEEDAENEDSNELMVKESVGDDEESDHKSDIKSEKKRKKVKKDITRKQQASDEEIGISETDIIASTAEKKTKKNKKRKSEDEVTNKDDDAGDDVSMDTEKPEKKKKKKKTKVQDVSTFYFYFLYKEY